MTLGNKGDFACNWESLGNNSNVLFRRGRKFGSTQTFDKIGSISLNYNASYSPSDTGVSYFCVYGWTQNPLIEYYIIDNWGGAPFQDPARPPGPWESDLALMGEIIIDDGVYDIWKSVRNNMPSIEGVKTFSQYWSVRKLKRTSGIISVSEHFKKWEEVGMSLGCLYEVALTVEGYQNTGSAEVTENTLIIG